MVATNRERSPFPVAPLGVLTASAAADAAGHDVDVLDLMFVRRPAAALQRRIARGDYDVIGLGIRNLDNCLFGQAHSYAPDVTELVQAVRSATDSPVVLGGGGFSIAPEEWLKRTEATCGVVGEAETALPSLLTALANAEQPALPGVLWPGGKRLPAAPVDLSGTRPAKHTTCDYRPYIRRGGFIGIQTKRGCASGCNYCTYPLLEGTRIRCRPAEDVVAEIEDTYRGDPKRNRWIYFTDGVFNVPPTHAASICEGLIARQLPLQWMAYANPIGLDDELCQVMKRSGCIGLELGIDAAEEKGLDALGKPFGLSAVRSAMQSLTRAELPFSVHLLFGSPGQTMDDVREAQRFLDGGPDPHAVFATVGIVCIAAPGCTRSPVRQARSAGIRTVSSPRSTFHPDWGPPPSRRRTRSPEKGTCGPPPPTGAAPSWASYRA